MAQSDPPVKYPSRWRRLLAWIDAHPRTGWYLVTFMAMNFLLNLADAFDVDVPHLIDLLLPF